MNLLEHYIKEIHSIKEYEGNNSFLLVDLTTDCYGVISRQIHFATKEQWENEKELGFYLA